MSGLNIADIFETVVATVTDKTALVVRTGDGHDEVRFSCVDLDTRVNQLARALAAMGIGEGDHVGCHLYDGNQYIEVTLAAYKVRAVPVNVNFRYVEEEMRYLFDNADLVALVYQREYGPIVAASRDAQPKLQHFFRIEWDGSDADDSALEPIEFDQNGMFTAPIE